MKYLTKSLLIGFFLSLFVFGILVLSQSINNSLVSAQGNCAYYVATNGSDSSDGRSLSSAWKTIQKAANTAGPGDTVCIRGGTYVPSVGPNNLLEKPYGRFTFSRSGQVGQPITFRAYEQENVIIDGQQRQLSPIGDRSGGLELDAEYLVFDGLEIKNFSYNNGMLFDVSRQNKTNHIAVTNCNIHHNGNLGPTDYLSGSGRTANGVLVGESGDTLNDIKFSYNKIHHNGYSFGYDHGMYIIASGVVLERNEFYENTGNGVKDADFENTEANWTISHNIFYKNGAAGLWLINNPGPANIFNNIAYQNGRWGFYVHGEPGPHNVENNLSYGNCTENYDLCINDPIHGGTQRNNIVDYDPQFVNVAGYDFYLKNNSPAIDAGKLSGESYLGQAPDIGVYEYVQAGDTTPPSVPTGLTATAVSSLQINLSWTASTDNMGVAGYRIYRCQGTSCTPLTQISTSAANSYSDTGLSPSTTYVYTVAAYDAAGNNSAQSSSASATTQASPDTTPPSPPQNVSVI